MSEEFRTSQYIFDQIEDALSNVLQPIAQGGQTTTFKKYELRESVESNLKKIDDLTNTVGTFSVPNSTIGETVTTLWNDNSSTDGVSNTKKINELMQTVGLDVQNTTISETNNENSLIYKVNTLMGIRPAEGILTSVAVRKEIKLTTDSYGTTSADDNYFTFENVPVSPNTKYVVSIPNGELCTLWFLNDSNTVAQDANKPIIDKTLSEFTTSANTNYISITIKKLNNSFSIGNIFIEKKISGVSLLGKIRKMDQNTFNLIVNEIDDNEHTYLGKNFLTNQKAQNTFLTGYALQYNRDPKIACSLKKEDGKNVFTVICAEVEEVSCYKIEVDGKKARSLSVVYFDKNKEPIFSEKCYDGQESFWTKKDTKYITVSFEGDSSDVLAIYEYNSTDTTPLAELVQQNLSVGATYAATKESTGNTGILDTSIKYQAIKDMNFNSVEIDDKNIATRKSDINSQEIFSLNNYEIEIQKSGYYLISGQIGFNINVKGGERDGAEIVSTKGAIVLRNVNEIPVFGPKYNKKELHFNEAYLAEAMSYQFISGSNGENFDKVCGISIPPKIVKLKQGDAISLKGKIQADVNVKAQIKNDSHSTYLTVLKLRDLPQKEWDVLLETSKNCQFTVTKESGEQLFNGYTNRCSFKAETDAVIDVNCEAKEDNLFGKCKIRISGDENPFYIQLGYKGKQYIVINNSERLINDAAIASVGENMFALSAAPVQESNGDIIKCNKIIVKSSKGETLLKLEKDEVESGNVTLTPDYSIYYYYTI